MQRLALSVGAVFGALAIAFGAFGAHALRASLEGDPDGPLRMGWWETASHYHLVHALALVALAALVKGREASLAERICAYAWISGTAVFAGTLYAMTLGGPRFLGAITPIGGTLLIVGWGALAVTAIRRSSAA
ncbi:MAG: DUF423 domain-containing protein [Myxococcota bacterium]